MVIAGPAVVNDALIPCPANLAGILIALENRFAIATKIASRPDVAAVAGAAKASYCRHAGAASAK